MKFFVKKIKGAESLPFIIPYIPESTSCIRGLSRRVGDFSKLNTLIAHHNLAESLELLEQYGFQGLEDLAVLAFMQGGGAV